MNFERLFLGYHETKAFEHLLIREKYITKCAPDFDTPIGLFPLNDSPIKVSKSSLLRAILLFESVDSNTLSTYDLGKMVDLGLIRSDSQLANNGKLMPNSAEFELQKLDLGSIDDIAKQFILNLFFKIEKQYNISLDANLEDSFLFKLQDALLNDFSKYKHMLYETVYPVICLQLSFLDSVTFRYLDSYDDAELITYRDIERHELPNALSLVSFMIKKSKKFLSKISTYEYNQILSTVNDLFRPNKTHICVNCAYKHNLTKCLNSCKYSVEKNVSMLDWFTSSRRQTPIFCKSLHVNSDNTYDSTKIIDEVYYMASLDLSEQMLHLPTPTSIREAINLRNRPEIKSFREVFANWCEYVQNGNDERTIELINKDFKHAQAILAKYHHEESSKALASTCVKRNLLDLTFECIGYFIPFLSLALGLPQPWIERKKILQKKKSEWFLLTK